VEIKPHPRGLEVGALLALARASPHNRLTNFFVREFSRLSDRTAREIVSKAKVPLSRRPRELSLDEAKALIAGIEDTKLMAPPTDCLSPIGEKLIRKSLRNVLGTLRPEFYAPPVSR
jgi:DNA topoisomerase-6 subunit B